MSYGSFLGYERDDNGNSVINEREATVVRYIYSRYLQFIAPNTIAKEVEDKKVINVRGTIHLGYETNNHSNRKTTNNRRNGYKNKSVKTKSGNVKIKVPRDQDASFEPHLTEKEKAMFQGLKTRL